MALDASYVIPIFLRRINYNHPEVNFKPGPFSLGDGVLGNFCNWLSIIWTCFITVIFSLPTVLPVTKDNMNYASVRVSSFSKAKDETYMSCPARCRLLRAESYFYRCEFPALLILTSDLNKLWIVSGTWSLAINIIMAHSPTFMAVLLFQKPTQKIPPPKKAWPKKLHLVLSIGSWSCVETPITQGIGFVLTCVDEKNFNPSFFITWWSPDVYYTIWSGTTSKTWHFPLCPFLKRGVGCR